MPPSAHEAQSLIGPSTLSRLAAAWPTRATVRTDLDQVSELGPYDPAVPDYPIELLPFAEHPRFVNAPEDQRRRVVTLAWLYFNERVIEVEDSVVNPTFEALARGEFPVAGLDRYDVREAAKQAQIDEVWHTYIHMIAMQRSRVARGVALEPGYGKSVTHRALLDAQAAASERWERDLLALLWTAVAEISVSAYLDLVAQDKTVQPAHALVCRLHSRDESAHGPVMHELVKAAYAHMTPAQQQSFISHVPAAIRAFGAEDFVLWPNILEAAGIGGGRDIVEDCRTPADTQYLVTDFSAVQRLLGDLQIADRVDFDFAALADGAAAS